MSFENPGDNKRCDHCNAPGEPYEYRGETFSGLCAYEGECLCPTCRDRQLDADFNRPVGWAQMPASQYVTPRAEGR